MQFEARLAAEIRRLFPLLRQFHVAYLDVLGNCGTDLDWAKRDNEGLILKR